MLQFLRWATFVVLACVVIGAALSYPLLRARFESPMIAPPALAGDMLPDNAATPEATGEIAVAQVPTARPTMTPTLPIPTVAGVIIQAPTATAPGTPAGQTIPSPATPTPAAIATTSLMPAAVSPAVNASATVSVQPATGQPDPIIVVNPTLAITTTIATGAPVVTTPATIVTATPLDTPTPTAASGEPAPGQKGAPSQVESRQVATEEAVIVVTAPAQPVDVTPIVVTTVEITPALPSSVVTPIVVTTVQLTPMADTPTPLPTGPTAIADGPLYSAPDLNSAIVGQVTLGEPLTIVGMYTEGTWYFLVTGQWIPGTAVSNAPLTLPLVFPTITPVPTNTPTLTPLPPPTETPLGAPTPTPTATSLDQAVCDCSGDTLDCLGNIFANRAQAQQCFEYCFRQTGRDIHLLDPNLNGMACENLP